MPNNELKYYSVKTRLPNGDEVWVRVHASCVQEAIDKVPYAVTAKFIPWSRRLKIVTKEDH